MTIINPDFDNPHKIPQFSCCKCNHKMDLCSSIDGEDKQPQENDTTICIRCGTLMTFNKDLSVHLTTSEEIEHLKEDKDNWDAICRVQKTIKEMNTTLLN